MTDDRLPLICLDGDAPLLHWHGQAIGRRYFLAQARQLAGSLPDARAVINLCEDRYSFLLGFVALILRGQCNLLPPDRLPHTLHALEADYCLVDRLQPGLELPQRQIVPSRWTGDSEAEIPRIPTSQRVATLFTSGSTGHSLPHHKGWGELYHGTALTLQALGLTDASGTLLATVPPQHMYGLETSILLPLLSGLSIEASRPFYPADVQGVLQATPAPRWLISTPLHLRACLRAELAWPALQGMVSATAPLDAGLAGDLEQAFACPLYEIYGSTETGAIATRRTHGQSTWQLHPGLQLQDLPEQGCQVVGDHLPSAVRLNDRLQRLDERAFQLLGRDQDLIKIAGKRASLGDLNRQLLALPGVTDGVFVPPQEAEPQRLMALVVAPGMDSRVILDALRERIDAVFLPRPLYCVDALPRNATGKLPRELLWQLIAKQKRIQQ